MAMAADAVARRLAIEEWDMEEGTTRRMEIGIMVVASEMSVVEALNSVPLDCQTMDQLIRLVGIVGRMAKEDVERIRDRMVMLTLRV